MPFHGSFIERISTVTTRCVCGEADVVYSKEGRGSAGGGKGEKGLESMKTLNDARLATKGGTSSLTNKKQRQQQWQSVCLRVSLSVCVHVCVCVCVCVPAVRI